MRHLSVRRLTRGVALPTLLAASLVAGLALSLLASTTAKAHGARPAEQSISYDCDEDEPVVVEYNFGEATAQAIIEIDDRTHHLSYSSESNRDVLVFEDDEIKLTVPNRRDLSEADGLFVFRQGVEELPNGRYVDVDEMVYKSCSVIH